MKKILITGATDGIGKLTALSLAREGHHLLIHGRSREKLNGVVSELSSVTGDAAVESYQADLSDLKQVQQLVSELRAAHQHLDVVINNAGILKTDRTITADGLDVRFVVNTIAPYLLSLGLVPLLGAGGRVVNVSSAAQAPVSLAALRGEQALDHMAAYSQSKLALTMWTATLAERLKPEILAVSVNPGSLLASKMVKEGFGVAGKDLQIGVQILRKAALSSDFADAHGRYFDNDSGRFAAPHPDAENPAKRNALMQALDELTARLSPKKEEQ